MQFAVPPEAEGLTLGRFLYDRLKLSRTLIRKAKSAGGLLVDGLPARTSLLLQGTEIITLAVAEEGRVAPEPMPLTYAYEDLHLLVVEKPAGIVIHPVRDYKTGTLAAGVAHHLMEQGESAVARPIQRLDRETSGLVLFAKNPAVAGRLSEELVRHKMDRHYIAFVQGRVAADEGSVTVPLRRVWGHPVAREVALGPRTEEQEAQLAEAAAAGRVLREEWKATGQRAVTHFTVLQRWERVSMVALRLQTGRTHQIRVHMVHLGHPLLGDKLYGSGGAPGRQALHAASLAFTHPVTGAVVRLESPLPADLVALRAQLDNSEEV